MERVDYGICPLDSALAKIDEDQPAHAHLTDSLGCRETQVHVYRVGQEAVSLATNKEQLCIPIGQPGTVIIEDRHAVPTPGFAFIPTGLRCTLENNSITDWVVIQAPGTSEEERDPVVLNTGEQTYEIPSSSEIPTAFLTEPLGATGMKVNLRQLGPGQSIPYHVEGRQEEVFVPISGPGNMRLAGRVHNAPLGSVTRVAPETPRSAVNPGDEDLIWLMVGAPPTGKVDGWDPGAMTVNWPG